MCYPLGDTPGEKMTTTEGEETTGKFFCNTLFCFNVWFTILKDRPSHRYYLLLFVLHSEEPTSDEPTTETTTTTKKDDKNGCTDECDPNCDNYIANNPDCDEGKDISSSY